MKITAVREQKRRSDRVSVYVDDEYRFACSKDTLIKFNVYVEKVIIEEEIEKIISADGNTKAFEKSLQYISRRSHSEGELRDKLKRKDFVESEINYAIELLGRYNYLDDKSFAEMFVRDRKKLKPRGKRALYTELKRKKLADNIITEELDKISSDDEVAEAFALIEKKFGISPEIAFEIKNKIYNFLALRGYNYDVIKGVIARLEKP